MAAINGRFRYFSTFHAIFGPFTDGVFRQYLLVHRSRRGEKPQTLDCREAESETVDCLSKQVMMEPGRGQLSSEYDSEEATSCPSTDSLPNFVPLVGKVVYKHSTAPCGERSHANVKDLKAGVLRRDCFCHFYTDVTPLSLRCVPWDRSMETTLLWRR